MYIPALKLSSPLDTDKVLAPMVIGFTKSIFPTISVIG